MEILSSTSATQQTEQGCAEESYSLVQQFGVYAIIRFYRVSGLGNPGEATVIISSTNYDEVRTKYKELCKFYKS